MQPPEGYEFRAPSRDDLDAVAEVLAADAVDDTGHAVLDKGFLREQWSRPGFDLATDSWVVVDGTGAVVGYGQITRDEPAAADSWGIVHPTHRGRGIGTSLFDRIELRAAEFLRDLPLGRFRHAINAGDHAAAAMIEAKGLQPVRHFWHMQIDLSPPLEPFEAPGEIGFTGINGEDDLRAVHGVLAETLSDSEWRPHPEQFDRWAREEVESPSYDPTLWLLATKEVKPVGAVTASIVDDQGWVNEIGVRATHRGRGIGAALLRRLFEILVGRGVDRALVNVDAQNPTGATALYERVGMRVVNSWDLWERSARGSA